MSAFETDDIEKMFAAAADAAEDTGEGDVSGKEKAKAEPPKKTKAKPEPVAKPKPATQPELKEEPTEPERQTKKAEPKVKQEPLATRRRPAALSSTVDVSEQSIEKILEMNDTFNKLNKTEREFVSGYFQIEDDNIAKVIHAALTANKRDLEALGEIVVAREKTSAERAFYLMSLNNNSIEAIYEQINLLVGDLEDLQSVSSANKIDTCRTIENSIAEMTENMFSYIDKLQEFTKKATE